MHLAYYISDSEVFDPRSNSSVDMTSFLDSTSGAIFSLDASFIDSIVEEDQGDEHIGFLKSNPFNEGETMLIWPESPQYTLDF